MPFLELNTTTVPVASEPVEAEFVEYGDAVAAHSGAWMTRIRARKRMWPVETVWMTASAGAALKSVLVGAAPHLASGDMVGGSVSVIVQMQGEVSAKIGGVLYVRYRFALVEA
jgi:hypothetical protein